MSKLKIKVCGMRYPENITGVAAFRPDYLGFIFYPKSKRFVGEKLSLEVFQQVPKTIHKVGVFVNENVNSVIKLCTKYSLQIAQLHGNESPEYCLQVKQKGLTVFKAFSVDESFDFAGVKAFEKCVDYFLFDTKGKLPGGTGLKFNWKLLEKYTLNVPFFLSGGIGFDDLESIRNFQHPQLFGVDINSGFEIDPGLKNLEKVGAFISELRNDK